MIMGNVVVFISKAQWMNAVGVLLNIEIVHDRSGVANSPWYLFTAKSIIGSKIGGGNDA